MSGLLIIALMLYSFGFGFLLLRRAYGRRERPRDCPALTWDHQEMFLMAGSAESQF